MRLVFTPHGWADYQHWVSTDRATVTRINRLIDDVLRDPFDGIGKPEPLRHAIAGTWSRMITEEHLLVYLVDDEDIVILGPDITTNNAQQRPHEPKTLLRYTARRCCFQRISRRASSSGK